MIIKTVPICLWHLESLTKIIKSNIKSIKLNRSLHILNVLSLSSFTRFPSISIHHQLIPGLPHGIIKTANLIESTTPRHTQWKVKIAKAELLASVGSIKWWRNSRIEVEQNVSTFHILCLPFLRKRSQHIEIVRRAACDPSVGRRQPGQPK